MLVRRSVTGDREVLRGLFEAVFARSFPKEEWAWKYDDGNAGYVLESEDGAVVGHTGYLRRRMTVQGVVVTASLRVDTMVDPKEQGKGVYRKLLEESVRMEEEQGVSFLYGFPSEQAKGPLMKVTGASAVTGIPKYRLVTKPFRLLSFYIGVFKVFTPLDKLAGSITTRKRRTLPDGLTLVKVTAESGLLPWSVSDLQTKPVQLVRDPTFVKERYIEHPDPGYQIYRVDDEQQPVGYVVTKIEERTRKGRTVKEGRIIDLALPSSLDASGVIGEVTRRLTEAGVSFIQLWSLSDTVLGEAVQANGYQADGEPMTLVVKPLTEDMSPVYRENWFITMGDVDSY